MKISRKMKKFFVTVLTVTLSIVMVVTSAGAINAQTCSFWITYEDCEDFDALTYLIWYDDWDDLYLTVDVSCSEDANIDSIEVEFELVISYVIVELPVITNDWDRYEEEYTIAAENTWDSDEIIYIIQDFERNCAHDTTDTIYIDLEVECKVNYSDGSTGFASESFEGKISNGCFSEGVQ